MADKLTKVCRRACVSVCVCVTALRFHKPFMQNTEIIITRLSIKSEEIERLSSLSSINHSIDAVIQQTFSKGVSDGFKCIGVKSRCNCSPLWKFLTEKWMKIG